MSNLFVLKEQLQAFYAKYSKEVDKIVQFLLAFIVFYLVNYRFNNGCFLGSGCFCHR